jgi:serine/threonine protein kinase
MKIVCPKCDQKYRIEEGSLPDIKKKNPKCKACGSYLFPIGDYEEQTVLLAGSQIHLQPSKHLKSRKSEASPKKPVPGGKGRKKSTPEALPEVIGPYQVVGILGKGGMGTVYKCHDKSLNRHVAVKVLTLTEGKHRLRFLQEARALAKLSHPNITQIYSAGDLDDLPYFAMEYVDGPSTEKILKKEKRFPIHKALDIVIQVCQGLKKAHETGFIHRDIKPANILINSEGICKITDFGLAKLINDDQNLTQTKMMMGTPIFLSPEQGKGEEVDFRTDVYALGVTLYRYIVGRPPFMADDPVALLMKHIKEPVRFPAPSVDFQVPPAITGLIRKMMAKNPDDRFLNYDALIAEVSRLKDSFQALQVGMEHGKTVAAPAVGGDTGTNPTMYDTRMDHTVMVPSKLTSSSRKIPAKLLMVLAVIFLLGFFALTFKLSTTEEVPEKDVTTIDVPVSPETGRPELTVPDRAFIDPMEIKVTEHAYEKIDDDHYRVYGKIRNTGSNTIEGLTLVITLIDNFDDPIKRQRTNTEPIVILPGEYARFSVVFRDTEDFKRYLIGIAEKRIID